MSLSQTEIIGFALDVIKLLEDDRQKLKSLGIDADKLIKELKELEQAASEANAEQESMKADLKDLTKKTVKLTYDLHVKTSGDLDMVMGAYGKNSPESKVIGRLRSKIKRRASKAAAEKK